MMMDDRRRAALATVAERFGTPCFVYDEAMVRERVELVRGAFDDRFQISYAVKSNPNRAVLRMMAGLVDRLDLSSGGELLLAEETGWDPSLWSFVGPAKRAGELRLALELSCGHVVVESEREIRQLDALASEAGVAAGILLRINPSELPRGFGVSMARRPTIFGIDEEEIDAAVRLAQELEHVRLEGFHVYAGTQCLDADALAENIRNIAGLFGRLIEDHSLTVDHLVFGSGFGIDYHGTSDPLDPTAVAAGCTDALDELIALPGASGATMALEMGRFLIGEAGMYVTSVLGTKTTRGADLLVLDGGMHHYLGASGNLGGVLKRNYPVEAITGDPGEANAYDLSGPLCTNIDSMGKGVEMGRLDAGDLVAIGCAGAYGLTSSPIHFISHAPPKEILLPSVDDVDDARDITRDGTVAHAPDWRRFAD